MTHPDLEIFVDVLPNGILLYFGKVPGYGGLPVGVSGHTMAMLSGGIDSPVAAWHMMKAGLPGVLRPLSQLPHCGWGLP